MHKWKLNCFWTYGVFIALWLAGCAAGSTANKTAEDPRMAALRQTFAQLIVAAGDGATPDSLKSLLTEKSLLWIEEIEGAAQSEPRSVVENRPFYEMMVILAYRILERDGRLTGVYRDPLLYLAVGHSGWLRPLFALKLGEPEIKGNRAMRGLAASPRVPVIFLQWEDSRWKFDLPATLAVAMRGWETIGIKKDWSMSKTALYLLRKKYRNQVRFEIDEELLDPVVRQF